MNVISGRVTTLDLGEGISNVEILGDLPYGNVTVNPDNTLSLVLSGTSDTADFSFDARITRDDGNVVDQKIEIGVTAGEHAAGWGVGDFYMLETDENDDIIVEHGENHRAIYVSNSSDALTLEDISAIEGRDIDSKWLIEHGQDYAGSPEMAVSPEVGMSIWYGTTGRHHEPNSNWLLFERGYEYDDLGRLVSRGLEGESELNPAYIGAYGEGDDPIVTSQVEAFQSLTKHVVVQGIHFTGGIQIMKSENMLFDDVTITGDEMTVQDSDGFTLRNSDVYDVIHEEPQVHEDYWDPNANRISGLYALADNVLIEGNFFDQIGWEDGYQADLSLDGGQPPSKFSHNVYIQHGSTDVTFRDNITMEGASFGAQIRPGGFIEDNAFIDNNYGVNFSGGKEVDGGYENGNYTLFTDNVVTSAAYKDATNIGVKSAGVADLSHLSSLVDNIVTHMADPNDPDDLASKPSADYAVQHRFESYYDDTIIYNWAGSNSAKSEDANIEGLNTPGVADPAW